ncbi:MAG: hypothetical protein JWM82_1780 [Myxococcales bacterium]|nr:hypothetical protein [Myxococcales bacterium]
MMGTVPNPVVLAAIKTIAYSLFGHLVSRRSKSRLRAVAFGVSRVIVGWIVGAIAITVGLGVTGFSVYLTYAILTLSRFVLWFIWIGAWYDPTGGMRTAVLWATAGTTFSAVMDLGFWLLAEHFAILQTTWSWC